MKRLFRRATSDTEPAPAPPAADAPPPDVGEPAEVDDGGRYEELRSGFTAAVSHELRTPLARLMALLDNALLPGARIDELVEQARREVDRIGELIDDVLFLSELESGREVVGLAPSDARPVLDEVVAEHADRAARAGVQVVLEGEGITLPLRPRMIAVVASNLTENAVSYAGPGSTLTLALAREDGSVVLSASDDGAGVGPGDLPRLFERFYRGDRARASRGSGLGLAVVKHVVVAAGGTVSAASERGRGLTVRCVFPAPP